MNHTKYNKHEEVLTVYTAILSLIISMWKSSTNKIRIVLK